MIAISLFKQFHPQQKTCSHYQLGHKGLYKNLLSHYAIVSVKRDCTSIFYPVVKLYWSQGFVQECSIPLCNFIGHKGLYKHFLYHCGIVTDWRCWLNFIIRTILKKSSESQIHSTFSSRTSEVVEREWILPIF